MDVSYSFFKTWLSCRKKTWFRYIEKIEPIEQVSREPLIFGSMIHECLQAFYQGQDWEPIIFRNTDENSDLRFWASEMMSAYSTHWKSDSGFRVIGTEVPFRVQIEAGVNLVGFIDLIAEIDGKIFIIEHKTASSIDGGYIKGLENDFQSILYCIAASLFLEKPVSGLLYNVLLKPVKIRRIIGETEEQFEARRQDAIQKNKSGKTNITRKMPESLEDFQKRLSAFFDGSNPDNLFYREKLWFSPTSISRVLGDISSAIQDYKNSLIRGEASFYRCNSAFRCKRCDFFSICFAENPEIIKQNFFKSKEQRGFQDKNVKHFTKHFSDVMLEVDF